MVTTIGKPPLIQLRPGKTWHQHWPLWCMCALIHTCTHTHTSTNIYTTINTAAVMWKPFWFSCFNYGNFRHFCDRSGLKNHLQPFYIHLKTGSGQAISKAVDLSSWNILEMQGFRLTTEMCSVVINKQRSGNQLQSNKPLTNSKPATWAHCSTNNEASR